MKPRFSLISVSAPSVSRRRDASRRSSNPSSRCRLCKSHFYPAGFEGTSQLHDLTRPECGVVTNLKSYKLVLYLEILKCLYSRDNGFSCIRGLFEEIRESHGYDELDVGSFYRRTDAGHRWRNFGKFSFGELPNTFAIAFPNSC